MTCFYKLCSLLCVFAAQLYGAGQVSASPSAPQSMTQGDKQEPPAEYVLEVNGKSLPVSTGKSFEVDVDAGKARMKLSIKPYRTFNKVGVQFQYPVGYSFEADNTDPNVTIWSMSGNSSLLMLQKFAKVSSIFMLNQLASGLAAEYERKNVKISPTSILLGGRKTPGKRLFITVAGQKLVQEVFAFSTSTSTFALIVQDSPTESGKETPEVKRLKQLLATSFKSTIVREANSSQPIAGETARTQHTAFGPASTLPQRLKNRSLHSRSSGGRP